jgi:hypothetical protein
MSEKFNNYNMDRGAARIRTESYSQVWQPYGLPSVRGLHGFPAVHGLKAKLCVCVCVVVVVVVFGFREWSEGIASSSVPSDKM